MKQQFFIILTILILISCDRESERVTSYYENGQSEWVVKYNSISDTTDKTIIGYYDDGTKKCIRNLKKGLENGEQIVFFSNGQIETVCNKKNGIQSGLSSTYFENGKLNAKGNYEDGLLKGRWELWNIEGDKFIRIYKKGILHGPTKEIRTDGSVVYGQYEDGKEIGEWVTKSSDSIVTMITKYESGTLQGTAKEFYSTGEVYVNGYFVNGKKDGDWEIYNKTGSIDTIEVYRNDTLIEYKIK